MKDQIRMGPGKRKYRRRIFLKLRALGYSTKEELKQFKKAIQTATWHHTPFNYPESLVLNHRQVLGAIKAEKKAVEAEKQRARKQLERPRYKRPPSSFYRY